MQRHNNLRRPDISRHVALRLLSESKCSATKIFAPTCFCMIKYIAISSLACCIFTLSVTICFVINGISEAIPRRISLVFKNAEQNTGYSASFSSNSTGWKVWGTNDGGATTQSLNFPSGCYYVAIDRTSRATHAHTRTCAHARSCTLK